MFTQDLHTIYTAIDTYTHNTGKNLLRLKKSSTQNERNQQTGDSSGQCGEDKITFHAICLHKV